jgi:Fe-S oxidoreductase
VRVSRRQSLDAIEGTTIVDRQSHCCGMAGSWGMMADNYELSNTIGSTIIARLSASGARWAVTDCPTCQLQMEQFGQLPVRHPVEVLLAGLTDGSK